MHTEHRGKGRRQEEQAIVVRRVGFREAVDLTRAPRVFFEAITDELQKVHRTKTCVAVVCIVAEVERTVKYSGW